MLFDTILHCAILFIFYFSSVLAPPCTIPYTHPTLHPTRIPHTHTTQTHTTQTHTTHTHHTHTPHAHTTHTHHTHTHSIHTTHTHTESLIASPEEDDDNSDLEVPAYPGNTSFRSTVLRHISTELWGELLQYDELQRELAASRLLPGFQAAIPCFPPTFKRVRQRGIGKLSEVTGGEGAGGRVCRLFIIVTWSLSLSLLSVHRLYLGCCGMSVAFSLPPSLSFTLSPLSLAFSLYFSPSFPLFVPYSHYLFSPPTDLFISLVL
jgi:O6-methylguanine-DNA--protein-cysteine methyltransferase